MGLLGSTLGQLKRARGGRPSPRARARGVLGLNALNLEQLITAFLHATLRAYNQYWSGNFIKRHKQTEVAVTVEYMSGV